MAHLRKATNPPQEFLSRLSDSSRSSLMLARNLRYLCAFYPSVSAVCRKTGLNRQQFNKYVTGKVQPSLSTLRRLADFFGLDVEEMYFDLSELRVIIEARKTPEPQSVAAIHNSEGLSSVEREIGQAAIDFSRSNASALRRYCGYYFRYHYAFDNSGRVIRSLFRIHEHDGVFITKLVERLHHSSNGSRRLTTLKYQGILMALSGCLFNVEYETIMRSCVGYAAFADIHRPGQRFIAGIQSSFSSSSGKPVSSRVVLERLSSVENLRRVFSTCGMFPHDTPEIDHDVIDLISNCNVEDRKVFSMSSI